MSTTDSDARAAKAAYMREYYARPENREKKRQKDREYALANRERARAKSAKWYAENKDRAAERNAAYRREIKALALEAKSQPCERCGGSFPSYVMEFHHRDPSEKKGEVCNMPTPNLARKELAKCDTLCANCHRIVENE